MFNQAPRRTRAVGGSVDRADRRARFDPRAAGLQIGAPIRPSHVRHRLDLAFRESNGACLCTAIMRRFDQTPPAGLNMHLEEAAAPLIENVESATRPRIDFENMPRRVLDEEIDAANSD